MNTKNIFNLTLLTIITSIMWLIFSIYDAYFIKENVIVDKEITAPINISNFDSSIMEQMPNKINYYK